MSKHVLLFVHGMGEYPDGWHDPALKVLSTAFSEYSAFKGKADLLDLVDPVGLNYSTLFTKLRNEWKSSVKTIKSTLGKSVDISLGDIFRGTAPFTLTMLVVLGLLMVFPQLSMVLLK